MRGARPRPATVLRPLPGSGLLLLNLLLLLLLLSVGGPALAQTTTTTPAWAPQLGEPPGVPAVAAVAPRGGALGTSFAKYGVRVDKTTKGFTRNGKPFHFAGFNQYNMMDKARYPSERFMVDEVLDAARGLGLTVMRTWAFDDGRADGLQTAPGVYDEATFRALDYVIAEAGKKGIHVLLALTNFWGDYGGMETYVKWCSGRSAGGSLQGLSVSKFYRNRQCRRLYKDNAAAVLGRVNTYTGRTYAEDPTIMGYDLANEPRNPGALGGAALQQWIAEMSAFIKARAPDQLVTTGLEGFYGLSTPGFMQFDNPGEGWWYWACQGTDFARNHDVPTVDFTVAHAYPTQWLPAPCRDDDYCKRLWAKQWLDGHVDVSRKLGKPFVLEGFGWATPTSRSDEARERYFSTVYHELLEGARTDPAVGGSLFWILSSVAYPDYDGYSIYAGQEGAPAPDRSPPSREDEEKRRLGKLFRNSEKAERCEAAVREAIDQGTAPQVFTMSGRTEDVHAQALDLLQFDTSHSGVLDVIAAAAAEMRDLGGGR